MRKEKVHLASVASEGQLTVPPVTCDSHTFHYDPAMEAFKVTFENGIDEDGDVVSEIVIAKHAFVIRTVVLLPEETVTVAASEYEAMEETIAILSDPNLVAELREAEADIAAGNLTSVTKSPRSFTVAI